MVVQVGWEGALKANSGRRGEARRWGGLINNWAMGKHSALLAILQSLCHSHSDTLPLSLSHTHTPAILWPALQDHVARSTEQNHGQHLPPPIRDKQQRLAPDNKDRIRSKDQQLQWSGGQTTEVWLQECSHELDCKWAKPGWDCSLLWSLFMSLCHLIYQMYLAYQISLGFCAHRWRQAFWLAARWREYWLTVQQEEMFSQYCLRQ